MSDLKIITRSMLCVMRPLIDQIELYSSFSANSDFNNFPCPEVDDICAPLLQEKDNKINEEIMELKMSLRDFYDAIDSLKKHKQCTQEEKLAFTNLIQNVYKVLKKKETIFVESINSIIQKCDTHFTKFVLCMTQEEKRFHLQEFGACASEALLNLRRWARDLVAAAQRRQLLLCVRQVGACLPLAASALPPRRQALRGYVVRRVSWCLRELQMAVEGGGCGGGDGGEGAGGQFLQTMDVALELISRVDHPEEPSVREAVDEVLCHAMSIAQVALEEDACFIKQNCHKALRVLAQMREVQGGGPRDALSAAGEPMQSLLRGALGAALERLEQSVNGALLRLVLEVFSEVLSPLQRLLTAAAELSSVPEGPLTPTSENPITPACRGALDSAVSSFDLHSDRLMQLGLFAVACSQDTRRIVGLRSCLASLESLEPELVPSVSAWARAKEQAGGSGGGEGSCARAMAAHWVQEVHKLQTLILGIVDAHAFCQVALEEAKRLARTAKSALAPGVRRESVDGAEAGVETARRLSAHTSLVARQLKAALTEEFGSAPPPPLMLRASDFFFACKELSAALCGGPLGAGTEADEEVVKGRRRLVQRCELVVATLGRLLPPLRCALSTSDPSQGAQNEDLIVREVLEDRREETSTDNRSRISNESGGSSLFFPESVKDLPLDQDSTCPQAEEQLSALARRGRRLAEGRSVLYRTPRSNRPPLRNHPAPAPAPAAVAAPSGLAFPRATPFARARASAASEGHEHDDLTMELDITNILEQLTCLSDTLTSALTHSPTPLTPCSSLSSAFTLASMEATAEDTLQRLKDLETLQQRLYVLKATNVQHESASS